MFVIIVRCVPWRASNKNELIKIMSGPGNGLPIISSPVRSGDKNTRIYFVLFRHCKLADITIEILFIQGYVSSLPG